MQTKNSIAVVRDQEARVRGLEALVSARLSLLPSLTRNIAFPPSNPCQFLVDFLNRYIENLPDFIDAMSNITKAAGIFDFTKTFIDIAQDFHNQAVEESTKYTADSQFLKVQSLVADAYLAHRLFEEMNDLIGSNTGAPFIPIDLTPANVIVHEILGEEFGNQLDFAVHYCIEALFNVEKIGLSAHFIAFVDQHRQDGWQYEIDKWPCLACDPSIKLAINVFNEKSNNLDSKFFAPGAGLH